MLGNSKKGYVKAIYKKKEKKRKLPTLKGRSKIKEGECLLSLGKTKEVSIKERHKNVKSRYHKKKRATNSTFGIQYKAPDVIR